MEQPKKLNATTSGLLTGLESRPSEYNLHIYSAQETVHSYRAV